MNTLKLPPGRLRSLRQSRGWSRDQLAEISGVSNRTIYRIELGRNTSMSTIQALAQAFDTDVGALLNDPRATPHCALVDGAEIPYLLSSTRTEGRCLLVYLHGLGLDHDDFLDMMDGDHRAIAPTLHGFHPDYLTDRVYSLSWHVAAIGSFIESFLKENSNVERVFLIGFSLGADIALQLLASSRQLSSRLGGVLALDCNLNADTCFISSHLANMRDPSTTVSAITEIAGAPAAEIDTCLARIHYVYNVFDKLRENLAPLQKLAADLKEMYRGDGYEIFTTLYESAASVAPVKVLLSDTSAHTRFVDYLPSEQTSAVLRQAYQSGYVEVLTGRHHFDLMDYKVLAPLVRDFVKEHTIR